MIGKRSSLKLTAIGVLLVSALSARPSVKAQIQVDFIQGFYANCHDFSVGVQLLGRHDDGGGLDNYRYQVIDGTGTVLYQEDAVRPVGQWGYSEAFNLPFQKPPTKNPVSFVVLTLNSSGKVTEEVQRARRDLLCLPASGLAIRGGLFAPHNNIWLSPRTETPLFDAPNGKVTDAVVEPGELHGVYRTADNQWIAVYFGRPELLWAPASAISPPQVLPLVKSRIERPAVLGQPTGVVIRGNAYIFAQPFVHSQVLGLLDPDAEDYLEVIARTADDRWWEVNYFGPAWVENQPLTVYALLGGDKLNVPITPYP